MSKYLTKVYKLEITKKNFQTVYFRSYNDHQDISEELKIKYNESLELYNQMTSNLPHKRPKCKEIMEKKDLWALNEKEFEINDELKNELILKLNDKNQIVFSIIKSKLTREVTGSRVDDLIQTWPTIKDS
jgi:hypothetical protein